ncbi:hypothetical protein M9H77_24372 [Catharanthus roseus]|uniref:Uncharacterized protein n=1 Tax=Catharanthus roseus TaxID=4058 RepID=A0ACC0AVX3_CATRO|nr:hypothetical protein M9H77_24372 [Catharanthus roseus]
MEIQSLESSQISYLAVQGNYLYAASLNKVHVFDLSSHMLVDTLSCKSSACGMVKSVKFINKKIVTAHQDCKIRVWQVTESKKHRLVSTLPTVKDRFRRCISASNYVQVRRHKQKLWIEHADAVSGLAINEHALMYPDAQVCWSEAKPDTEDDQNLYEKIDRLMYLKAKPNTEVDQNLYEKIDKLMYSAGAKPESKVGLDSNKEVSTDRNSCEKSSDTLMYSISWDKSLKIWRMSDLSCLESINNAHSDAINAIVVCPNKGIIYTASADGNIKIWEKSKDGRKKKHKLLSTLEKHNSSVNALVLNNDGSVLFSGGCEKTILVWERDEDSNNYMMLKSSLFGHKGAILCLIYLDGLLISGSSDKTVRIWKKNKEFGQYFCMAVLEGHSKGIKSLVAIPYIPNKGNFVTTFSGSLDGEIIVWQVSNIHTSDFQVKSTVLKHAPKY